MRMLYLTDREDSRRYRRIIGPVAIWENGVRHISIQNVRLEPQLIWRHEDASNGTRLLSMGDTLVQIHCYGL